MSDIASRTYADEIDPQCEFVYEHRKPGQQRSVAGDAHRDGLNAVDVIGRAAQRVVARTDEHVAQ